MTATDSPSPSPEPDAHPRLNVFALPSRTTLLLALIVLVMYLPLVWAWRTESPVCMPFLLAAMVILPLRRFLSDPEQVIEQKRLRQNSEFPILADTVKELATTPAKIATPQIFISPNPADGAFVRGSFARKLIGFASSTAEQLTRWLQSGDAAETRRAHALILHELAHFRHHDVALAMLSRSILAVAVVLMTVAFLVHLLTPLLYYRMLVFFLYPGSPFVEMLRNLMPNDPVIKQFLDTQNALSPTQWSYYIVTIFASFLPLIIGSAALWLIYWRALVRTRELYADARVAQWQGGDAGPLWEMLWIENLLQSLHKSESGWRKLLQRGQNALAFDGGRTWKRIKSWFSVHPADERRERCFDAPHEIYGDNWSIGLAAGAAVLLLNFNLASLFLSQSLRGPNSVPPFVLGFVVITISLLPFLCQYRGTLRGLVSKIGFIVALFTLVNLIPLYVGGILIGGAVSLDSNLFQGALEASVRGELPPGFGSEWVAFFMEQFFVRPALLFTFFMPVFLVGYVLGALWLVRRMLRWYDAPFLARHSGAVFWYVIGVMTLILVFVILPWVDELTVPTAHDPLAFETLTPILAVGMFAVLNGVMFIFLDRQYRDRCPRCGENVAGDYFLARRCGCGELLNPWLLDSTAVAGNGSERATRELAIQEARQI